MKKLKSVFRDSYPYFKNVMWILVLCTIIGFSRMAILLVEPQIISLMVDRVITPALGGNPVENSSIFSFLIEDIPAENLWHIMGILVVAFVLLMAIYFVTFYVRWNVIHFYTLKIENQMRKDVLEKVNREGQDILKDYTAGDLITIVNSDTGTIRNLYIATIPFMLDAVFYILFAAYFLFRLNVMLMILPMITFIAYAFITKGFIRKCETFYDGMWEQSSALNTEAQESIYGIRTVKAYAAESYRAKRFYKKSDDLKKTYCDFGNMRLGYFLLYDSADQILMLISMVISIILASQFKMTGGEYTSFLSYLLMMAGQFVDIIFLLGDFQAAAVSGKRMFGMLNKKNEAIDSYGIEKVSDRPHIIFQNVSAKSDEQILLDGVSVDIPYGKKIGIMGKTGSGKSVFLKTLQGFNEFTDGSITIDGRAFKEYDKIEIARACSYAMQDVFLFSNSISSNIAFYAPDGDENRVYECGKMAEVDEFVSEFPQGYDTIVGEKGFGLSGGQKQRVAIARALYKDAPIIVLDDCTSALDVETERKIFSNLKSVCKNKSVLIATHRALAIQDMDEILFFENGKIVERGSFEELMKLNGRYANIYRKQTEGEVYIGE